MKLTEKDKRMLLKMLSKQRSNIPIWNRETQKFEVLDGYKDEYNWLSNIIERLEQ